MKNALKKVLSNLRLYFFFRFKIQLLEDNLDRADENVSRLSNELQLAEKERDEMKYSLQALQNSEQNICEKADNQVGFKFLLEFNSGGSWLFSPRVK